MKNFSRTNHITSEKVSIFMPVYNASKTIRIALDSVLSQEFSNFKVYISDDCSTDGTQEILKSYGNTYPDIFEIYFQSHNLGVARNCNFLLKKIKGEFIIFTAGDDVMMPNRISKAFDVISKNDIDLLFSEYDYYLHQNGQILERSFKERSSLYAFSSIYKSLFNTVTIFAKSKIYENLFFDERYPLADAAYHWEALINSRANFYHLSQKLVLYGRDDQNLNVTHFQERNNIDLDKEKVITKQMFFSLLTLLLRYRFSARGVIPIIIKLFLKRIKLFIYGFNSISP